MVTRALLALAFLSGCTLVNPFGLECVSDQNCGCANCCIAYRCTMVGPLVSDGGSLGDAGSESDAGLMVWKVTTFAGGARGAMDGLATAAQFANPGGLAIDAADTLYVADTDNNCVRAIAPDGTVRTLAAARFPCGGTGLRNPQGVAVDEAGAVYVADTGNHCIRRISAAGVVETFAGTCDQLGGACRNAPDPVPAFDGPFGLVLTPQYLFVTEVSANHVRWVRRSDRSVGTLAGQGFGSAVRVDGTCGLTSGCLGGASGATFYGPSGIAELSAGVLFVTDSYNCALRKIVIGGCAVQTLGRSGCPMFVNEDTSMILRSAFGIGSGAGPLLGKAVVADTGNHRIVIVDAAGNLTPIAGTRMKGAADGLGSVATFQAPSGIAVDSQGRIFVADSANHRIRLVALGPP